MYTGPLEPGFYETQHNGCKVQLLGIIGDSLIGKHLYAVYNSKTKEFYKYDANYLRKYLKGIWKEPRAIHRTLWVRDDDFIFTTEDNATPLGYAPGSNLIRIPIIIYPDRLDTSMKVVSFPQNCGCNSRLP